MKRGVLTSREGLLNVIRRPDIEQSMQMHRIRSHSLAINQLRNAILDRTPRRVRHLQHLRIPHQIPGPIERNKSERCGHICSFEKLRMIAHLSELHDEIHQSFHRVVVVESRGARDEVGDRDVFAKRSVHDFLTRCKVAVDVDLNLSHDFSTR